MPLSHRNTSKKRSGDSTSANQATQEDAHLAQKHLGIIAERSLYWWRFLPPSVKAFYDADDMAGEVVLRVVRFAAKYDPAKAKESTWVWRVAENTCKGLVSHYHTQQYSACETVELVPESEKAVRRASDYLRVGTPSDKFLMSEEAERRQAFDLVERVIEAGSDAVLDLLDQIFSKGLQERPSQTAIGELRSLAARFSATVDDFEQVYAWVE